MNRDGTVWGFFNPDGYSYDHRDDFQKDIPFDAQMTFFTKNSYDFHMLLLPFKTDVGTIIDKTLATLEKKDYPLKESGRDYLLQLKDKMGGDEFNKNTNQYQAYIGIQLDPKKNRYKRGNKGTDIISSLKQIIDGMNNPIRTAVGLDPYDIPKAEIDAYLDQMEGLERELSKAFISPARPLSTGESMFLAEYSFMLSGEKTITTKTELAETVQGYDREGKPMEAIRPNKQAYYDLQNAQITAHDGWTIRMLKPVKDEIKEEYVRYLIVDKMESVNVHPGFEWVYRLQSNINFPIGLSIRGYHRPNSHIRKELSDSLMQFKDQKIEAEAAGSPTDTIVEESADGAKNMEALFQKSGQPVYNCSFVIRITGKDVQELKVRTNAVRDQLDKDNISASCPYGEAHNLMAEFFPGSKRESNDFLHVCAPGVIAGMMFGATTNIGDNRGYPIGFTSKFKKPVFIQPDLAAKDFENMKKKTSSLAVMVTGETGNGKSVFMNVYAYLSALTQGSRVLIIDPKGDRKEWAEGLPLIDKKHLGVWTLGKHEKDAGSLDPFRTAPSIDEGKAIWLDIASYIIGISLKEGSKYTLLSEAVEVAALHNEPCGEVIVQQLEYMYQHNPDEMSAARRDQLEELIAAFHTIRRDKLSSLLFGKVGQDYNTLSVEKSIQVIMVENLQLPSGKDWKEEEARQSVKISEGILLSLTAFTKQFIIDTPQSIHKIVMNDEAKTLSRSKMGRELVDWLETNGRHFNASSIKGTQNATDHISATNIGMKFTFQLPQRAEAIRMLEFYNLARTEENIRTLQTLELGECLFQDIYGQTAVIHINAIFKSILDAFRTDPTTEAEREAERESLEV